MLKWLTLWNIESKYYQLGGSNNKPKKMEGSKGISKVEVISKKKMQLGTLGQLAALQREKGFWRHAGICASIKKNTYFYFSKLAYVLMYVPVDAARRWRPQNSISLHWNYSSLILYQHTDFSGDFVGAPYLLG